MFYKEELKAQENVFIKITSEISDSKQPYSTLNLFNIGKHNSHLKQEKPHDKSSKCYMIVTLLSFKPFTVIKASYEKPELLSNDEHEFVKSMCIFVVEVIKQNFVI